jgi:hypothetical protein
MEKQRLSAAPEAWRRLHGVELRYAGKPDGPLLGVRPSAAGMSFRKAHEGGSAVPHTHHPEYIPRLVRSFAEHPSRQSLK